MGTRLFVSILTTLVFISCSAAAASAADLPEVKERGKLIAATSGNLPPVSYLDENNELVGYDIEVAKFVEDHLGVPIELVRLDWKGILPGLQTGRFDAVFSNVNITEERKEIFDYSIPYSRSAVVVVAREGTDIQGPADLPGKAVGAISGGMDGEIPAHEIEDEFGAFEQFKGYAGYAEMFADMAIGRIDAVVAPDTAAANFIRERPGVARIVGEPYRIRYVGVPMAKGSDRLKAEIDEAIRSMREQGLLDEWGEQYFGIKNYSEALTDEVP
jgi:ABC-type amino acid transport substrate-binding protein